MARGQLLSPTPTTSCVLTQFDTITKMVCVFDAVFDAVFSNHLWSKMRLKKNEHKIYI